MNIRSSGATIVTVALLVLLPALAILQYRWVGQVSTAERERMQRNLRNAAAQFREAFDGEIARAFLSLQVGPATAREGGSERYSDRYDTWVNTAAHPQIVADVFLVDADSDVPAALVRVRLRRWNPVTHAFDPAEWPERLERWRSAIGDELAAFNAGRPVDRRAAFRDDESLIVMPLRNLVVQARPLPGPQTVTPVFGFTVIQLNMQYIREQMIPELAQRHFAHADGDTYRVAVTSFDDPSQVLYRSDPDAPTDVDRADATTALFGRGDPPFFFPRGPGRRDDADGSLRGGVVGVPPRAPGDARPVPPGSARSEESGRWRLLVQHQSGSLESAVARVRRRNLAISFGVLLLLSVSIALLAVTSRRAQRLARQQMEFVAGVSHELRTPVAVIRSAAENLSHGVVGGERVKRYGETIDAEARRLGEMVERVLQYAGIEAGLGLRSRTPLAPGEIIETAIAGSMALFGPEGVNVQREIAPDLPAVVGDASALRSAIQNLIANAVKYGGNDRWVGIRADHVHERRRSEVRITVTDHGAGIPSSDLPRIFEPFYRGAEAVARQVHGNGLGLSLVKRIIAAHGGRVTVSSRMTGTSFAIFLPAAAPDTRANAVSGEVRAAAH